MSLANSPHLDPHYTHPKLAELYDYACGWSEDREYFYQIPKKPQRILDLGCGTGLICHAYAKKGHSVTGMDPSSEMLKIAREKEGGEKIEWIESTSQSLRINKTFDLIIMTGHAFQVLMTEKDVLQTFKNVKRLLAPEGQFVFESRNPNIDWPASWDYEIELKLPTHSVKESRHYLEMSSDKMTFILKYEFQDETLESKSVLRFWTRAQIAQLLKESDLESPLCLGDWDGQAFDKTDSQEMIFHARHRK